MTATGAEVSEDTSQRRKAQIKGSNHLRCTNLDSVMTNDATRGRKTCVAPSTTPLKVKVSSMTQEMMEMAKSRFTWKDLTPSRMTPLKTVREISIQSLRTLVIYQSRRMDSGLGPLVWTFATLSGRLKSFQMKKGSERAFRGIKLAILGTKIGSLGRMADCSTDRYNLHVIRLVRCGKKGQWQSRQDFRDICRTLQLR